MGQTVLLIVAAASIGRQDADRHEPARNRCTIGTLTEPSPTAAATRFTPLARTSPTANTPGTLVSIA